MSDYLTDAARRNFLKASAIGAAALTLPAGVRYLAQDADERGKTDAQAEIPGKGKAKHLIVISLPGGPSHIDTFDPKTEASVRGEFKQIDTAHDDIKLAEPFENLAKVAGEICLVRSMHSREGNHERARYLTHTGHVPNPTVKHPTLGSILAEELGDDEFELPAFVAVGNSPGDGGYLGPTRSPLLVSDPSRGLANLEYRAGMDSDRMEARLKLRAEQDEGFKKDRNKEIAEAQAKMYEKAKRMMDSKKSKAFDISDEKDDVQDEYGRNNFGRGALLARRLINEGVTCVEISLGGWDTHNDNFNRLRDLGKVLDQGLAALIKDLKDRDMLDETVVACYGEFGRTPRINANTGRDHYPRAWSMMLSGGPFPRGKVVGATDETGSAPAHTPISVPDFFHSMAHAFGYDAMRKFEVNERPIWYSDKEGMARSELFL